MIYNIKKKSEFNASLHLEWTSSLPEHAPCGAKEKWRLEDNRESRAAAVRVFDRWKLWSKEELRRSTRHFQMLVSPSELGP